MRIRDRENATFSTITGMDRAIIGLVTSGFKEMAAREKPKALSFWFRFLQAAARRKVWELSLIHILHAKGKVFLEENSQEIQEENHIDNIFLHRCQGFLLRISRVNGAGDNFVSWKTFPSD